MDSVTLILDALRAGLAAASGSASRASAEGLILRIRQIFKGKPEADCALQEYERQLGNDSSEARAAGLLLSEELRRSGADRDQEILNSAAQILATLTAQQSGKFNIHANRDIHTVIQADNVQVSFPVSPTSPVSETATTQPNISLLKREYLRFIRRLEPAWSAARQHEIHYKAGQVILAEAYSRVLDFRAELADHPEGKPAVQVLDEVINRITALQHHRIAIDGGRSVRAFWDGGDQIIAMLNSGTRLIVA